VPSCSFLKTEQRCTAHSGVGSVRGLCVWRKDRSRSNVSEEREEIIHRSAMTSLFETCSPSLLTCPDGFCDELELSEQHICPQDCTGMSKRKPICKSIDVVYMNLVSQLVIQ